MPAVRLLTRCGGVLGLAAGLVALAAAQGPSHPLEFRGLRAGMPRADSEAVLRRAGATLSCQPTREPRITACSATLQGSGGPAQTVTLSLVDDRVAIALVAGPASAEQISAWHEELTIRYGETAVRRRGPQESFQWIRQRQMLRLTVRREGGGLLASVSLIDGALLDGLPRP